ncbi:3,4-dihydroxy-2-butanone-4-phosphate synthase [Mycolicibacterium goodii]|uniref:3,4-dihydroxy-2-butanone-4-phosphate synthase n=1 Tax=Mycolicibacterium goodii TaxID=134601 RepID=UPI00257CB34D|nr:3,4-dihydroxy-2-butanone-4-phosphate synthase [Mycolicibacterium goodii]
MTTVFAAPPHPRSDDAWPCGFDQLCANFASGQPAVLVDSAGAALAFPAETASSAQLHFAIRHSSGLIHAAAFSSRLDALRIPDQPVLSSQNSGSGYTVAVDAAAGIGTGISAHDRATTARLLAHPRSGPEHFIRPGHVLPIRCDDGGFRARARMWELSCDAAAHAGREPVTVVCRLVRDDGDVRCGADVATWARTHDLPVFDLREWTE